MVIKAIQEYRTGVEQDNDGQEEETIDTEMINRQSTNLRSSVRRSLTAQSPYDAASSAGDFKPLGGAGGGRKSESRAAAGVSYSRIRGSAHDPESTVGLVSGDSMFNNVHSDQHTADSYRDSFSGIISQSGSKVSKTSIANKEEEEYRGYAMNIEYGAGKRLYDTAQPNKATVTSKKAGALASMGKGSERTASELNETLIKGADVLPRKAKTHVGDATTRESKESKSASKKSKAVGDSMYTNADSHSDDGYDGDASEVMQQTAVKSKNKVVKHDETSPGESKSMQVARQSPDSKIPYSRKFRQSFSFGSPNAKIESEISQAAAAATENSAQQLKLKMKRSSFSFGAFDKKTMSEIAEATSGKGGHSRRASISATTEGMKKKNIFSKLFSKK
jgi:hypothetical protein